MESQRTIEPAYLEFCREVLSIRSLSGEERQVASFLMDGMRRAGFDEVVSDRYGNIIGTVKGSATGPVVVLEGHMDTVPVPAPEQWKHAPFESVVADGKLYGRGAADMKSALCAMIWAIGDLLNAGWRPSGDVHVVGVVYEEVFEGIAFGKALDALRPDFVILGEATELQVYTAQKGRAEIVLETFGKNAHSANPEKGVNAADALVRLLSRVRELPCPSDSLVGDGLMVLTDIKSLPYPGKSVIPHLAKATYDRRLIVGETENNVLAPIQDIIDNLAITDETFSARALIASDEQVCYTGERIGGRRFFPAWSLDRSHQLVRCAIDAVGQVTGVQESVGSYYFCTDGSESAGRRDIATIGIGPSSQKLAHVTDEYVPLDHLVKVRAIYAQALINLYA